LNKRRLLVLLISFVLLASVVPLKNMLSSSSSSAPNGWTAQPFFRILQWAASMDPTELSPAQIRAAYNLPSTGGSGTIAIVDAYDDPTVQNDLNYFSSYFGLPTASFQEYKMSSGISANSSWALEISLDVEWAHAVAPSAKILLVEATSDGFDDLLAAVDYARGRSDVVAISMSWGGGEFPGESSYDSHFISSYGASFFASSGDTGGVVYWPAVSANVVGVGGTTLTFAANGSVSSETAWSGSGGGISAYETEPSYQVTYGVTETNGYRGVPDVSYDADPNSGVLVYDSTPISGESGWWIVGGTSVGAPQWAAIQSLGLSAKNSNFYVDAKSASYSAYFRDITSGSNGYPAKVGYDLVTGLGSPLTTNYSPPARVSVTLNAPSNDSSLLPSTVSFTYTPLGVGSVIQNSSLWTNATGSWVQTVTNATTVVNGTQNTMSYALNSLGTVVWNVEVFNSTSGTFASSNYTLVMTNDVVISTTDDLWCTGANSGHMMVRTSTGILYAVYDDSTEKIYVKASADDGQTWVNTTLLDTLPGMTEPYIFMPWQPCIAEDSKNNLFVVWKGNSSSYGYDQIWFTMYNGTAWSSPLRISTFAGMNTGAQNCPVIAVDSVNDLHVAWYGYASGYSSMQIWECDYNGTWSAPVRISTYSGMNSSDQLYPSIAIDSSNNLDVDWRGSATGYAYSEMWFAKRTGTSWSAPTVISTYSGMNGQNQISPVIAVDSDNVIYAGWQGDATGYSNPQIWIAMYNGTWNTPVMISTFTGMGSYAQGEASIAVDTLNRVYVLWHGEATGYSDNDKVWCSNRTGGVWSRPQCLQPSSGLNTYPNVRWSNYPSFNVPSSRLDYVLTVGTGSPYNVTFSYLPLAVNNATVHLLLSEEPAVATYAEGQSVTLTVDELNELNLSLSSTLTLTVTGPKGYCYFDFQSINVTADAVGEYSFTWNVPAVAGTYVVEASLVPMQLTAYDAAWLKVT
jgi:hypothetical protein